MSSAACRVPRVYLLNQHEIAARLEAEELHIEPYDTGFQQHTSYLFRLGAHYERTTDDRTWEPGPPLTAENPRLPIDPRECVRVQSYESFRLDEHLFGILGSRGALVRLGITLLHGPFIEPHFPKPDHGIGAPLLFALVNHLDHSVQLDYGAPIGKVSFFDISDTYPVELVPGSILEREFARRVDDQ
jgi:deoxycytidine triphosphate deaminase